MRILFAMLVSACLAAVTQTSFFQYLLLTNYYGNNQNGRVCRRDPFTGRRRCHRDNSNLLRFAPFFLTPPTPPPMPGCFPDSAVFERLTKSGQFEPVHAKDLVLGDEVKCLKATDAFLTERPEIGACKYVARQHSTDETLDYHTVSYLDNGIEKSISMTRQHVMWATQANNHNESVVAAKDVKLDPQYLIRIEKVLPGDLILVEGEHNTLEYRRVISHKIEKLEGINLPGLTDGGLPFVNGVLATTTARDVWGGHWVNYFKRIWLHDVKFADANATYWNFVESPLTIADVGHRAVDNDCFLKKILADKRAGVDITDFDSYDKFALVYMVPCISEAERAKIGAKEEMREW